MKEKIEYHSELEKITEEEQKEIDKQVNFEVEWEIDKNKKE